MFCNLKLVVPPPPSPRPQVHTKSAMVMTLLAVEQLTNFQISEATLKTTANYRRWQLLFRTGLLKPCKQLHLN